MGICGSVESREIHDAEDCNENVIFLQGNKVSNGALDFCSLYSKQGSKGLNQDAAILHQGYGVEDGALCGVFDGHGKNGHVVSKLVCNHLPSLLLTQKSSLSRINAAVADDDSLQNMVGIDDESMPSKSCHIWKEACISAFKVMDKEIKLQENLDCSCSGTTAVVAIRQGEDLIIANLGDSRAILGTMTKNEVTAVQLTTDLKPGLPCEAERIKNCNGRVAALKQEPHIQRVWLPHEDTPGLAMSRAFGDFVLKDHGIIAIPNVYYHRLTSNDQFIILATDGVWDVLSNDQVAAIVWAAKSEQAAARVVVEAATTAWRKKYPTAKVDDCSVVCLFLQKK
ncbi:probable protein phosphatase 2C 72 [Juglans microcarpa x Juglans regia]|uniref:probable protein phosphatase 2C 72 n=1 Tax=Juglans microcarpa x Juglans regia TaxID=2249226 RepID=UPI001B7ED471|nr:probable protein phosphatase 2C 72 [Juglans microcarpa x Juglans regia]